MSHDKALMSLIIYFENDLIETFFKSWNVIDIFLKTKTKFTHLNKSEYHSIN